MNGFIYIIRNTVNSKVYIGQTKISVDIRWKEHLRHARYGDQLINRAMRKYGIDKFYIETLEICNLKIIDDREIYYIDLYDSINKSKGYNVSIGGKTPRFLRKVVNISTLVDLYVNQRFSIEQIANKVESILKSKSLRGAARLAKIPYSTFRKACIYNNIEYNSSTSAQHLEEDENVC